MIIQLERTPLTEIAKYFCKNKWGEEGVLLGCLREGKLVAHIEYPTDWASLIEVPKDVWKDIDIEDFDILSKPTRAEHLADHGTDYYLSGEHFYEDAFEDIKSIADAAVNHDTSILPKSLLPYIQEELGIDNLKGFNDWMELIRVFHLMAMSLKDDSSEDFPVFVLDDDWHNFKYNSAPRIDVNEGGKPQNIKRNAYWPNLLGYLLSKIIEEKQETLCELTGTSSWEELSRELLIWAKKNIQLAPNTTLPGQNSIYKDLKKFEDEGLK